MRVVFVSYGTRGDAQPQVALAASLRNRGYAVRVAAPENLRGFVEASGIEYVPLTGNSQEILESDTGRQWLSSGNVQAFMKALADISKELGPKVIASIDAAARDADAIVAGTLCEDFAFTVAENRGLPFILAHTIPFETTGEYPSPIVTQAKLPFAFLNRLTYTIYRKLAWSVNRAAVNGYRATHGLQPLETSIVGGADKHQLDVLQLWSEHVLPRPADARDNVRTVGYVRLPAELRDRLGESSPPAGLVDWLSQGTPPIYFGFGSMPVMNPPELVEKALAASRKLGRRAVFAAGWANLDAFQQLAESDAFFVRSVDHSWLLPRCAAAMHHGGAGTTAASLEAGVPTVVCSVFADQPFWGTRVARLGVGTHLPYAKISEEALVEALRKALSDDLRAGALALGVRLRKEDGATRAVDGIIASLGHSLPASRDRLLTLDEPCRRPNRESPPIT